MNKDNTLIPQHRFPEFNNDGSWDKLKVEEIIMNESSSLSINKLEFLDSGYKLFGADGLVGYIDYYKQEEDYIAIVKDGSGAGRLSYYPAYSSVVGTLTYLKIKDKKLNDLKFQYYNLHNIDFKNHIKGGGIPHIYYSDYKNDFIGNPTNLAEQQKIAACLSSLDDVIAGHEEKLTALEEHKKGLMQNLFPQEGETQPKYRFPEFENDGDWVEKKLGEVADYSNGRAHEQEIDLNGKFVVVNSKFISSDGNVVKYSNAANCLASKNDILMVLSDVPNGKAIAKCHLVEIDDKYTVNQRVCKLTPKSDIDARILYYITNRNKYFLGFDDGAKQTNLRNEDVLNFVFLLPKKLIEQQKIASVLSSVDELIVAQREKIAALKEHKKGLMQGLFPKIES